MTLGNFIEAKKRIEGQREMGAPVRQVATQELPQDKEKKEDPITFLEGDKFKKGVTPLLGSALTKRWISLLKTEIYKNPKLKECDVNSFGKCIKESAQLGLEPGILGHIYFVPFKDYKTGKYECQTILGYQGMLELVRRSGEIASIQADVVDEADEFVFKKGLNPVFEHVPSLKKTGNIICAYALVCLKNGSHQFEVVGFDEIKKTKDDALKKSKGSEDVPWKTHFEAMAKKTALRKIYKFLPINQKYMQILIHDEYAEAGVTIEGEAQECKTLNNETTQQISNSSN